MSLCHEPGQHWDNLLKDERRALNSLRQRTDIVIKKADKRSATIVMCPEDYVSKVRIHLDDGGFDRRLDEDSTEIFQNEMWSFLEQMTSRSSIERELVDILIPKEARVSYFYVVRKIHKPGTPGRPTVSFCGSSTEGIHEARGLSPWSVDEENTVKRLYFAGRIFREFCELLVIREIIFQRKLCHHHVIRILP